MRVPLAKVPLPVVRQAARHLESIRGTEMGVGVDGAVIGPEACPIFRPDVRGVAYWEFEIVGLKRPVPEGVKDSRVGTGTGFIVVANGRHDMPVPHWSFDRNPPSRALEQRLEKGVAAGAVHKLDALCYVAEDADKRYLTHLGQFPPLVVVPAAAQKLASFPISETHGPPVPASGKVPQRIDLKQPSTFVATIDGKKPPALKMQGWGSWAKAKSSYKAAFARQLSALQTRASGRWEIEDQIAKFGEGIHAGATLVVPLLKPGKASISGDGAAFVKMTQVRRKGPGAVQLTALDSDAKQEQHLTLNFSYADGTKEALLFFVVPSGTPSGNRPPIGPVPVPIRPIPLPGPTPMPVIPKLGGRATRKKG